MGGATSSAVFAGLCISVWEVLAVDASRVTYVATSACVLDS